MFSLVVVLNISLTMYSINKYGKQFIVNAYKNYRDYRSMNMETLVALGSVSAFALFLFFMVRYTIQYMFGELDSKMKAMM